MKNDELEQLYKLYYGELYLYAYSLCRNHYTAQEIVSDVFFKALLSLESINNNVKFWMLRVCRNLVIDYFRKSKKISNQQIEKLDIASDKNILQQLIQNESKRKLYEAIINLPENYRETIIMFYFLNMPTQEIAATMGIKDGAIRMLLNRARNKLREHLKEEL